MPLKGIIDCAIQHKSRLSMQVTFLRKAKKAFVRGRRGVFLGKGDSRPILSN